ncbi:hypothetical protein [Brumimicrobium salinarum]|nr:hypothetical protein [Brumimicrobium salinarum]
MFKLSREYWMLGLGLLVYLLAIAFIAYGLEQDDFGLFISAYGIAFSTYLVSMYHRYLLSLKQWKMIAFLLFLVPLFSLPSLSPDVYRFLWDGEITLLGIHPYAHSPNALVELQPSLISSEYLNFLYTHTTDLSKGNYTVYPTVHQVYFLIPTFLSDDLFVSLIILRVLMIFTMALGAIYFLKLLHLLQLPKHLSLLLFLNPILIIEVVGNLHFEGVVLAWLVIGIYFLIKKNVFKSALFWSIAINVKLTPLILLPFVLRFSKLKFTLYFYLSTFVLSVILLSIYMWPSVFLNFFQSIELYFVNFEFNGSVFSVFNWLADGFVEGNPTLIVGPITSLLAFVLILWLAFYKPIYAPKILLERMMWGYVIYLLFATTVHPWYVVLPLGLAVFSANLGVIMWSFLIMLSYGFYALGSSFWGTVLIAIEYLVLFFFLFYPSNGFSQMSKRFLKIDSIK